MRNGNARKKSYLSGQQQHDAAEREEIQQRMRQSVCQGDPGDDGDGDDEDDDDDDHDDDDD